MEPHPTPIVLEIHGGGRVVALVESGEPVDDVLRRAIEEAAARTGDLVVIQLIDDPSALRRGLAKAILARDLTVWSRGVDASVEVMEDGSTGDAVALVRGAACLVISHRTACSGAAMAVLRSRVPQAVGS